MAWEHILAGQPEQAPNYRTTDHWWAMTIDIDKRIGSGNCTACKTENDVADGFFRRVERARVDPEHPEHPLSTRPTADMTDSRTSENPGGQVQDVLRPEDVQPLRELAVHAGLSGGRDVRQPDGVVLVDKSRCLGCRYCVQACPYGCRFIDPRTQTVDKCTQLPPHHERPDDGLRRGVQRARGSWWTS